MRSKAMALAIIYLMIMLPAYISDVFAADDDMYSEHIGEDLPIAGSFGKVSAISYKGLSDRDDHIILLGGRIDSVKVYGKDGIDGYLRSEDQLTIKANVAIDGEAVTPEQVKLGANFNFSSCALAMDDYECSLTWPAEGTRKFSNSNDFIVNLYDNKSRLVSSLAGQVRVDNKDPSISSFSISPKLSSGRDINLSYDIKDYDYSSSYGYCSGINRIEFYENSMDSNMSGSLAFDDSSCSEKGNYGYNSSGDGEKKICAVAYDNFEQISQAVCDNFTIDTIAPDIAEFGISNPNNDPISHIKDSLRAVFAVTISGEDIDGSSVKAGLSSLNNLSSYLDMKPSRIANSSSGTKASWDVEIKASGDITPEITVYAADFAGNNMTKALPLGTLSYDDTAPVVSSITTDITYNGSYYVKSGLNNFYAEIVESGSGLDEAKIAVEGMSITGNCTGNSCRWDNVSISSKSGTLDVAVSAKDKLGNSADYSAKVFSDTISPILIGVNISSVGGENDTSPGYTTTGDKITIAASFSDANGLADVYADLSRFIDGADQVAADSCTKEASNLWKCEWITSSINRSGHILGDINFVATDNIGNTLTIGEPLEVLGIDEDENPNYWRSAVMCTPRLVDRETASLVNTQVYCHVPLISSASDAEILETGILGCYDPKNNSLAYVSSVDLLNAGGGSKNPYLAVELVSDPMRISSLSFYCTLGIFTRAGSLVTKYPEYENVTINIQFYNMPLGEISQSVQDKIDDAKDFSFLLGDWVGTMQNILGYGEKICKLINTIMSIYGLIGVVGLELSIIESWPVAGLTVTAPREAMQYAQSGIGALSKEGWQKYVNQFCKFFSCRLFYDEVWGLEGTAFGEALGNWQRNVLEAADWVAVGGFLGGSSGGGKGDAGKSDEKSNVKLSPTDEPSPGGVAKRQYYIPQDDTPDTSSGDAKKDYYVKDPYYNPDTGYSGEGASSDSASSGVSTPWLENIGIGGEYGVHAWTNSRTGYETIIKGGGVMNPKESIVISTLTLCIPGIIYNLNKLRQIQCVYIDCMQNYVKQGLPLKACEDQKHYATCKYWWGEIFQLLPFTGIVSFFGNLIKGALSSPLNIVDAAIGLACSPLIEIPEGGTFAHVCLWNDVVGLIGDIGSDLEGMFDKDYWKFKGGDYCERIED